MAWISKSLLCESFNLAPLWGKDYMKSKQTLHEETYSFIVAFTLHCQSRMQPNIQYIFITSKNGNDVRFENVNCTMSWISLTSSRPSLLIRSLGEALFKILYSINLWIWLFRNFAYAVHVSMEFISSIALLYRNVLDNGQYLSGD